MSAPARRDRLERRIEAALDPGYFIDYRASFEFGRDLEAVATEIAELVESEPDRAATLYEAFLAGCYEKAEEIDDSSGSFGDFVGTLFCGWIGARQAAGASPEETAAGLLAWIDDDPYGFCSRLEGDLAAALDRAGRAALVKLTQGRFRASEDRDAEPSPRGENHARRRSADALRALYLSQRDVASYAALAEETGLTAEDCHAVATMLSTKRSKRS